MKIELEDKNHTMETNDCNFDNIFYSAQKGKLILPKERER
jgi:hypothetical protein